MTQTVVNGVFPRKEDLELLAHVREVDLSDSELADGDDDGFLAVVIANRLPQPGSDDRAEPFPASTWPAWSTSRAQTDVLPPPTPDNALVLEFDSQALVQDLRPVAQQYAREPGRFRHGIAGLSVIGRSVA